MVKIDSRQRQPISPAPCTQPPPAASPPCIPKYPHRLQCIDYAHGTSSQKGILSSIGSDIATIFNLARNDSVASHPRQHPISNALSHFATVTQLFVLLYLFQILSPKPFRCLCYNSRDWPIIINRQFLFCPCTAHVKYFFGPVYLLLMFRVSTCEQPFKTIIIPAPIVQYNKHIIKLRTFCLVLGRKRRLTL